MKSISKIIKSLLIFVLLLGASALSGCLNYQNRWIGGLGLVLAQVEDGVIIKDIRPTFESEDDALLPGDMILQIDGTDVSAFPKEAVTEAISGPVGALVSVTVLRSGEVVTFEIERIMLKKAVGKTLHSRKMKTVSMTELSKTSNENEAKDAVVNAEGNASDETNAGQSSDESSAESDSSAVDTDRSDSGEAEDTDESEPADAPADDAAETPGPEVVESVES